MRDKTSYVRAYRYAAKEMHPDRNGDSEQWKKLEAAKTLLDSLHNRKGQS
jgi:DnaJ-class molecular chaperone